MNRRTLLSGTACAAALGLAGRSITGARAAAPRTLSIDGRSIEVNGRSAKVYGLAGPDGRLGLTFNGDDPQGLLAIANTFDADAAVAISAPLNGPLTPRRRLGTQSLPIPRMKALGTAVAGGVKQGVVAAHLTHLTHHGERSGHSPAEPLRTITGAHRGEQAMVAAHLVDMGHGEGACGTKRFSHGVRDVQPVVPRGQRRHARRDEQRSRRRPARRARCAARRDRLHARHHGEHRAHPGLRPEQHDRAQLLRPGQPDRGEHQPVGRCRRAAGEHRGRRVRRDRAT